MLVKRQVVAGLQPGARQTIVPHVVALTLVRNAHGAMGLFGTRPALLVLLALAVIGVLAFLLAGPLRHSPATQIGFGMVVGGALGNVVDRVVHGYVIDYVALPRFYVFNLADACISCGLVLIALPALRGQSPG